MRDVDLIEVVLGFPSEAARDQADNRLLDKLLERDDRLVDVEANGTDKLTVTVLAESQGEATAYVNAIVTVGHATA